MHKKVLFLIPSLNYGGAELLMIQQMQVLKSNGWTVYVAVLSNQNESTLINTLNIPKENLVVLNVPYSTIDKNSLFYAYKNCSKLIEFTKSYCIHIVVAHLPLAHFWGRLLKRKLPQIKLLIYHHSMQYQANPLDTVSKKLFNYFNRFLAYKTDDVTICISEAVKQNIKEHFILNNPVVLYNAIQDKGEAICIKKDAVHSNIIHLLLPGRLNPVKGHLFFLEVIRKLIPEIKYEIRLKIAGGGALEETINGYLKMNGLSGYVTVTGFLSNDILLKEMCDADFVVIPSISEGLGLVAIEALMLGKTVLASDAGGLKEIIHHGQNGYLFNAGNELDCFNVCRSVLSNYPSSLLPEADLKNDYKHRFSFETHMNKFIALLS